MAVTNDQIMAAIRLGGVAAEIRATQLDHGRRLERGQERLEQDQAGQERIETDVSVVAKLNEVAELRGRVDELIPARRKPDPLRAGARACAPRLMARQKAGQMFGFLRKDVRRRQPITLAYQAPEPARSR